jgi:predicted RNA binding protein YcfA (HicA-like mRNA interferase family)
MTNDVRKQQGEMLIRNGFVLARRTKHHVWKHTTHGITIVCPASPSDRRAVMRLRQTVRKLMRENDLVCLD